jgi:hypothetical protein
MPADLTQAPAAVHLMAKTKGVVCALEARHAVGPGA